VRNISYEYTFPGPNGTYSSGKTLLPVSRYGVPVYQSTPYLVYISSNSQGFNFYCHFSDNTSNNMAFGDEYRKNTFFYQRVVERTGGDGRAHGATVHCFQNQPHLFDEVVPTEQAVYRQAATGSLQLLQRERTHYSADVRTLRSHRALRPLLAVRVDPSAPTIGFDARVYSQEQFDLETETMLPDTTVLVRYGERGDSVVTVTATGYRDQRPVRTATRADGKWAITRVKRLADYDPALPGVAALRAHNFNPVVEAQTWQRPLTGTDSLVTGGQLTLYDPRWRSPASTWRLDLDRPQRGLNNEHVVNGRYAAFLSDTRYRLVGREAYDPATGDPVEQRPARGLPAATVWGYRRTAPVAEAQNAAAAQVAYAGFEAGELGRWQGPGGAVAAPGYTGGAGYDLGPAGLACTGLPGGAYRLSCWCQGSAAALAANGAALAPTGARVRGWAEYAADVPVGTGGAVALAGTGHLDELRLCPAGARMTTYTHDPLVGLTSQTDPSGRTTTYEYDALGRLIRTRDEQGHILSQQQYHYARP